jgi:hypothetical protein
MQVRRRHLKRRMSKQMPLGTQDSPDTLSPLSGLFGVPWEVGGFGRESYSPAAKV